MAVDVGCWDIWERGVDIPSTPAGRFSSQVAEKVRWVADAMRVGRDVIFDAVAIVAIVVVVA